MGDQPGAGGSRSYKIRGYTRERQSAKPYTRPSAPRKVSKTNVVLKVIETTRWLVKEQIFFVRKGVVFLYAPFELAFIPEKLIFCHFV